ncbi:phage tail tape measure protein [Streptomyces sp. NPDC000880]
MAQTLAELLVGVGIDTEELTTGAQGAADDVENSLGGIQAAAAGAAVGGLFAVGLASAMDASTANGKLTRQLGLTRDESARAGKLAGDVFSLGFGESIDSVNEAIGAVSTNIGGMGNATDAELQQMTKGALALADTFEFDVGESTAAMGTLIKTGMAKDGVEAMDLLTATAQKLPPAFREELPALTKEYGEFFDQMGFTGPEMMGLLTEAAKNPTFELDKMGDALKEFTLLMADTEKVKQPLADLGLDVKEIQKLMNTGQGTEAFDQVTTALRGVEDQTERTALQAALFGGPGEDMGNSLLNLKATGADAATGLDDAAGAAKGLTDSSEGSQSLDAIWRSLSTTLGEMLMPALTLLGEFMAEHPGLIKILVPILLGLALAIGIAVIAQWAWNTALWAFPGTWIIAGIIALIAIIVLIVVYWDEIAAATGRAWDWIVGKLSGAWDWITAKVSGVWDWISEKIGGAWDWIETKVGEGVDYVMAYINELAAVPGQVAGWFGDIVDWVAGLPGRISRAASGMWDGIKNAFIDSINFLIWKWNNLSFTLGGGSILGVDIPSLTLNTPNIPYLADGGITTGPTLAVIGEGSEQEAVLPLSKLDGMLRGVATAVRTTGDGREQRVVLDVTGADKDMVRMFRKMVRTKNS